MSETHPVAAEVPGLPFRITAKALAMAKEKFEAHKDEAVGIRLGVKGGGCSGYSYVIDFAKKVREGKDLLIEVEGLPLVIDHKSLNFLKDCVLDWESQLMSYGFRWHNPHANAGCGCGSSFRLSS